MDRKTQKITIPDYKRIYFDLIQTKFPEKWNELASFFQKTEFSVLEIIELNDQIFNSDKANPNSYNQKMKAYDASAIKEILSYQKIHNLNNRELAAHFGLSRNTVSKWNHLEKSNELT